MTSARTIRGLVDTLIASGGVSTETLDRLDLRGHLDPAQLAAWAEVAAGLPIAGIRSVSALDEFSDPVDLALPAPVADGQEMRIQVFKATSATTSFCLTTDGVRAAFADFEASTSMRQVWVACDFSPFRTESCSVDPWNDDASEVPVVEDEIHAPDPRRLVKDFVGKRVPKSVFPYLLVSEIPGDSAVFDAWRDLAGPRLLHSLVNEVVMTDLEHLVVTGTRARKIESDVTGPYSTELFAALTNAARWVYASGRDVDTRFVLFTYELSREWPDALKFKEGFAVRGELALEAARTAFSAHVRETSKETLKSLGDLRKMLSEEVAKVVSHTRELLSTMWRDFMVATTALLGRVVLLGAEKPLSNPGPLKALLAGAAAFLVFSLVMSLRTNAKFMKIADISRMEWRRKLYGFINDEDFAKLSDAPLAQSTSEYKRVVGWVILAYVAVISSLLWSAWDGGSVQTNYGHAGTSGTGTPASSASAAASHAAPLLSAPSAPSEAGAVPVKRSLTKVP